MNERRTRAGRAGLLVALLWFGPLVAASPAASETLPFSFIDNRPFVDVQIDGKGPFSFIVDTGSSSTTVSAALAKSLQLPEQHSGSGSGAGERQVRFPIVHVEKLTVGPISFGPFDAPALDTAELSRVIGFQHFDGVLGAELFREKMVTMDAARGQITFVAAPTFHPAVGAVPIHFTLDENEMPVVTASISGVTGSFAIDTGDRSNLTLFGPFWRLHHLDRAMAPTVQAMTGYGMGGPILGIVGRPADFSIGGLSVSRPVTRLSLQKAGAFTRQDRAGNIGMGILRRFRVSFDYPHRVMWLSKGPNFDTPDLYDRSGLWLGEKSTDALDVVAVTQGSPAADAGIRAGDVLTTVGDVPAGRSTLFAVRALLQAPGGGAVAIRGNRNGCPYQARIAMRDQIAPP